MGTRGQRADTQPLGLRNRLNWARLSLEHLSLVFMFCFCTQNLRTGVLDSLASGMGVRWGGCQEREGTSGCPAAPRPCWFLLPVLTFVPSLQTQHHRSECLLLSRGEVGLEKNAAS